jgi:parallel beta-helix repeat protein
VLFAALTVAAPASARELVDDDRAQCPTAPHTDIQAGVDAASPGELVEVCDGTYSEQVAITGAAKDGVRLVARRILGATIRAPQDTVGAIVKVEDADRVKVSRFRIVGPFTGPGGVGCPPGEGTSRHAVLVTGNFNASINAQVLGNSIHHIVPPAGQSCPSFFGFGVEVTNGSRARVANNTIEDFGFGGVAVTSGAAGLVDHNAIEGGGFGVHGFNEARLNLNSSSISATDIGVFLERNFESAVRVAGNRISGNRVGIALSNQVGGQLTSNRVFANDQQGIFAGPSAVANVFRHNDARGNGGTDCFDLTANGAYSGPPGHPYFTTANKWGANRGSEASPAGICTP